MRFGLMITQGPGGHPSWKHAEMTAERLIVDPDSSVEDYPAKYEAAGRLRSKLRDALEKHHEDVRQHALAQANMDTLEPEGQHLDAAIATVQELAKGTVLETHYARPEVMQAMREVLACQFRTQRYIHREERAAKGG